MRLFAAVLILLCQSHAVRAALPPVQTVFVIVMENMTWSNIEGNTNAPYLNGTLLPMASYCERYFNPPGLHPSLPNYIWIEAGTNFSIYDDADPVYRHVNTTNHFTTLLQSAGISWKSYFEDVSGAELPLTSTNSYTPRHNPFIYFDDVSGTNDPYYPYGLAHIRPFFEFQADLTNNALARYNFLCPNLCNDGHDVCLPLTNSLLQIDTWLSNQIPAILASAAYTNNGALFIMWDEGDLFTDGPLGMVLLSPLARAPGYASYVPHTHSSFLRTLQEIFHVSPLLGDAANANTLIDLFTGLRLENLQLLTNGALQMQIVGAQTGSTNFVESSEDLLNWTALSTNIATSAPFTFLDENINATNRFYRVRQTP